MAAFMSRVSFKKRYNCKQLLSIILTPPFKGVLWLTFVELNICDIKHLPKAFFLHHLQYKKCIFSSFLLQVLKHCYN